MSPAVRRAAVPVALAITVGVAWPAPAADGGASSRERSPFARYRSEESYVAKLGSRGSPAVRGRLGPSTASSGSPGVSSPSEVSEFNALGTDGTISPSDTVGAAGPSHVLTAVNVSYALWDKAAVGAPAPLLAGTLRSLFPSLPGGTLIFDPKVVYDHYRGRFVLIFLAGRGPPFGPGVRQSRILVVSIPQGTAADPATWCRRKLKGDHVKHDGQQLADYPGLGFDRERLYITTNQFTFTAAENFEYAQILAVPKTQLYDCGGKVKVDVFAEKETRNPGGGKAFTIQPAVTETETGASPPGFLLSFQERTCGPICGKKLTLWRIMEKKGKLRLSSESVNVGKAFFAPLGTQKDGSPLCVPIDHCWDTGDLRLINAFYDADRGRLYAAHAVRTDVGPGDGYLEAVVRWYEVDPSPLEKARATRKGVVGAQGLDSGWPVVATDGTGNLFITYSRAGAPLPGEYLSALVATIPPGATSPDAVTVLRSGEALYMADLGRFQRWGDYNGINRDPLDPFDVWTVNQFAESDGSPPGTNLWRQVVNRLAFT